MEIRTISWQQTIPLRHSVLWPNKSAQYCYVDGDAEGLHFGAYINEDLVCVASVYLALNKARLRKFATDAGYQNQGIGTQMMIEIKEAYPQYSICSDYTEISKGFWKKMEAEDIIDEIVHEQI